MRVAASYSETGVDFMIEIGGIIDRICELLDLWIDAEAFELGPEIEFDEDSDHPFDAVDADHPDETDLDFDDHGETLICLRCGNASDCCSCDHVKSYSPGAASPSSAGPHRTS